MAEHFQYNDSTVAATDAGLLRGFQYDGVYCFHGIRYAQAGRFQMPRPVDSWEGIRDAVSYGFVCPTDSDPIPSGEVYIPHRFWPANENCQYLNLWTGSLSPDKRRPVFVWLHGGGFSDGSSIEQAAYEGDQLAKYGDVVVVTVNHRLNILGFLDMSSFGEQYWNSGNAGMADIVAALTWIRNNILSFGGDPDNVTVCGQSGGGGKVQTLLQIPSAQGLFHKGIIMSGIHDASRDQKINHRELAEQMMTLLGIPHNTPELLERAPYAKLMWAFRQVHRRLILERGKVVVWGPVKNDWYLGDPRENPACPFSKDIPMIVGSVFGEFSDRTLAETMEGLSPEETERRLVSAFGGDTRDICAAFKKAYPKKALWKVLSADCSCRPATVRFAQDRALNSDAKVYLYLFAPEFQMRGPTEAWHCSDIPFLFHNVDRTPYAHVAGAGKELERHYMGAFLRFMNAGDPGGADLNWPAFGEPDRVTMVFGETPKARKCLDDGLLPKLLRHMPLPDLEAMVRRMALAEDDSGKEWAY